MANILYDPVFIEGPVRQPILGDVSIAAVCRIPGTRHALWVACVDGAWKAYRTKRDYLQLLEEDNSVFELSTILDPPDGDLYAGRFGNRPGQMASLTVIDGSIYCAVTGHVNSEEPGVRYCRIYRSDNKGISWQLHSVLPGESVGPRDGTVFSECFFLSEIAVDGDTWGICYVRWQPYTAPWDLEFPTAHFGYAYSTDQGQTWTEVIDQGFHAGGGIYGTTGSRNLTKWKGQWWFGATGNVSNGLHWKTPDLINVTLQGNLGTGNSEVMTFPLSSPSKLYTACWLQGSASGWIHLRSTEAITPPIENHPNWSAPILHFGPLGLGIYNPMPWIIDLNPDGDPEDPADHLWVSAGKGRVRGITAAPESPVIDEVEGRKGQINSLLYRYTPISVNVGYEHGSVETFDYSRAMESWTERLTDSGVPIPTNDPRRP